MWKIVNFFLTMRSGGLNLHLESGSRWWCKELPDLVWHKLKTLTAREPGVLDRSQSVFYFVPQERGLVSPSDQPDRFFTVFFMTSLSMSLKSEPPKTKESKISGVRKNTSIRLPFLV